MPDVSRIDQIIDQAAQASEAVPGVVAVWGVGTGKVVDAILTAQQGSTQYVRSALKAVVAAGTVVVDPAENFLKRDRSASVSEVTWTIRLRHYLAPNDEPTARRLLMPLAAAYLTVFASNTQLNGTVNSALITSGDLFTETSTKIGHEAEQTWFGLQLTITAIERLDLQLSAGPGTYPP